MTRTIPVQGPADDIDRLLARLEAEEAQGIAPRALPVYAPAPAAPRPHAPVALLVDPTRLFGVPGHAHTPLGLPELKDLAAAGRRVAHARAYLTVDDEEHAREAETLLRRAGYEPVIRVGPPSGHETRVRIALDAAKAAREGCTVILATHDAALAELAAHLREEGARCELAGIEGHLPARLVAVVDEVHVLPARGARGRLAK